MGKKPIVSVTYENEKISIKKQLTSLTVFSLYKRLPLYREKTVYIKTHSLCTDVPPPSGGLREGGRLYTG